ncbi:MAG: hypothetical protein N0E44_18230 [Candidatus Thiodiazotropha lotti]|nr:hypothetical protein [Candidatus Thiodiazotropha lotti]MCW4221822.1 hypothetical protein [Candidatus Thiodiazotropha lotti]
MNDQELFHSVTNGDESAIAFMQVLSEVSQIWDDLIDRDKDVTNDSINQAFIALISTIPRNRFYIDNFSEVQPLIEGAILDWLTANEFENEGGDLNVSFVLRDNLANVLIGVAKILGGMNHAISLSPRIRQYVHGDQSVEEYKDGIIRRR